ncbi:MAG: hypothetical protein QM831_31810 [Kofleriaceae bacterium]
MRIAVVLVALVGCGHKDEPAGSGSGSASVQPKPPPAIDASTPDAAIAIDAAVAATAPAGKFCCCFSSGDADHYSVEGDAATCNADDMHNGSCVSPDQCGLSSEPSLLVVGTAVTVDDKGLNAYWATKEAKAFGALEIKVHGKDATLRVNGSDNNGFKKAAKIPMTGPITVTAQADGTALVSNGTATWVLDQDYRYGSITAKKK